MAFRKIKAKKYNGISEYFNPKSKDKETRALYLSYRDEIGKNRLVKLKSIDKLEALEEANKIRDAVRLKSRDIRIDKEKFERTVRMKDLTLDELAGIFFEQREAKNNHKDKGVYTNRIPAKLGKKKVKNVSVEDITALVKELREEYSPKTVNNTIDLLTAIFSWGIKKELTQNQPISRDKDMKNFVGKETVSTETGRVLKEEELQLLFKTLAEGDAELKLKANPRLWLYMKLLYFTGARPDAILSVKVADINFDTLEVRIKAMKKSDDYMQPLRAEAVEALKEWIEAEELNHDDHFIFYPRQKPFDNKFKSARYEAMRDSASPFFEKLFNKGKTSNKRRIALYSLRRTSATVVYRAKGLAVASKFLHHSDVRTTMKYLGINEDVKGAIDVL